MHRIGAPGSRAVVIEVPASVDGPHLIFKNDCFGAPVRNDADTAWMKERQIDTMYRARFEEHRHATEVLDTLFGEASADRGSDKRAWLIAVAHPRIPRVRERLTRGGSREVLSTTEGLALSYAGRGGNHPLESVDLYNPRPGLDVTSQESADSAVATILNQAGRLDTVIHNAGHLVELDRGTHPDGDRVVATIDEKFFPTSGTPPKPHQPDGL
ncbi:hypothetical protein GCM10027570_46400 [Streptomonospora sediminis]